MVHEKVSSEENNQAELFTKNSTPFHFEAVQAALVECQKTQKAMRSGDVHMTCPSYTRVSVTMPWLQL